MRFQYAEARIPLADPQFAARLNAAGAEGWELVNFQVVGADFLCVFKKPLP